MSEPPAERELELTYVEAAELGFRLHTQKRFEEAESIYRALLAADPNDANVLHYLGVLLYQTGRRKEAAIPIERSLAADDTVAAWHNNYGNVLLDAERFDEAAAAYRRCTELDPSNIEVLSNLGLMYRSLKRYDEAETVLTRALAVKPDFVNAHFNLCAVYWATGRFEAAHLQSIAALKLFPHDTSIRQMLAQIYGLLGRLEEAAEIYREVLELDPENLRARHLLAACGGLDVPERADDRYVESLFDQFAESFDAKLAVLDYRAPEIVAEAIERLLAPPDGSHRVLDAGCGTGLCGPHLAPYARRLVGVDLSANMIDLARARDLYSDLVKAELVEYLESVSDPYDVIVSADTLCYFGRLDRLARAARHALREGGLLIFTVEAHSEDTDFKLHAHGRYSHRADYVREVIEAAGFAALEIVPVVLRSEAGLPVHGLAVVGKAHRDPART